MHIPAPSEVENFPFDEPKAKIVVDYVNKRLRVVVRDYYWDPIAKRGKEKRRYIGYVVDNVYYSTEDYRALFKRDGEKRPAPVKKAGKSAKSAEAGTGRVPTALRPLLAAELPLYYQIAIKTGLREDLIRTWGTEAADDILGIAFQWLHTANNAASLFQSWAPNKLLPGCTPFDSKAMGEFFAHLAAQPGWRESFFADRINRLPEEELLAFDASAIASKAREISYARFGLESGDGYQQKAGLILLVGRQSGMPVLFRLLPGQITDVTTVQDALFRFDLIAEKKKIFAAVVDRSRFSLENIASFVDNKSRVIMSAGLDAPWVREAVEKAMPKLREAAARIPRSSFWGGSIACSPAFADGIRREVWCHVYRSDGKSALENDAFFGALDEFEALWSGEKPCTGGAGILLKSPLLKFYQEPCGAPGKSKLVRNMDELSKRTRYFGFLCNVSTMKAEAADVLRAYEARDLIERAFLGGRGDLHLDATRAQEDVALQGRFVVAFTALTILCELRRRMKLASTRQVGEKTETVRPLADEMTMDEVLNCLEPICLARDAAGGLRWMEVTQRQHEIAERLGFPGLYVDIPDWVPA